MLHKLMLLAGAAVAFSLASPCEVQAWGAYHTGFTHVGPGGAYHWGRTTAVGPYGGGAFNQFGGTTWSHFGGVNAYGAAYTPGLGSGAYRYGAYGLGGYGAIYNPVLYGADYAPGVYGYNAP